jgi:two-component system, NtrC family, sensor kinase
VISGVAQELARPDASGDAAKVAYGARQILAQVDRASQVTRHLAEAAAPHPAEIGWVDLNAMLRRALQLTGYDKRYRHIVFECRLDAGLPAVQGSGESIQQVVMQVIGMGCDAMVPGRAYEPVLVQSRGEGGGVEVVLAFPVRLDFERPQVQRSLLLARAVIEPMRGRLAFGQEDEPLMKIKLSLPANVAGA